MKIFTNSNIDPLGVGTWAVTSTGDHAMIVFRGSLFECCRWTAQWRGR